MTRYATPAAFKQAVEQRLRTTAARDGTVLVRLRQLLVFDRFLARVFRIFGDVVVLKGGLVLELRLARARTTKDVDLRVVGDPATVLPQLQAAGRLNLDDHLTFSVGPDPRHPEIQAEGMRYQGLRYRAEARMAGKIYGTPFGVDVAFAEPMRGIPDEITGSRFLEFAGVEPATLRIYPLETHIAEKLHALTMPRLRPNSRVKDLPDIALLASVRAIHGETLRSAIDRTFEHRATHAVPSSVPTPSPSWSPVYERIAANDGLPWPTLADVASAVQTFLDPLLAGGVHDWQPEAWAWSSRKEQT